MTQNFTNDTVTPPTTEETAEAVVVKIFKTALILYTQGQVFTVVKQDSSDHWLVNAAFRATRDFRTRPERGLTAVEGCPCHVDT